MKQGLTKITFFLIVFFTVSLFINSQKVANRSFIIQYGRNVSNKDLMPYLIPNRKILKKCKIMPLYFAYFDDWDVKRNYEFVKSKIDFKGHTKRKKI